MASFKIAKLVVLLVCLHTVCAAATHNTTTTSTHPTTTTSTHPTTTVKPTNGTTPATTTPAPTPEPVPTPVPAYPDNIGSWNITEANVTCILLKAAVQLAVNYTDKNNVSRVVTIDIPPTATVSGSCSDPSLMLSWQHSDKVQLNNTLTFAFKANETAKNGTGVNVNAIPLGKFVVQKVGAVLHKDESVFPNATDRDTPFFFDKDNLAAFPTTLNHSFACAAGISIGSTTQPLTVRLENAQFEAFRGAQKESKEDEFSAAEHCSADEISSGSVIGTVIITILIIVLVALGAAALGTYILKKRRAAVSGYENM